MMRTCFIPAVLSLGIASAANGAGGAKLAFVEQVLPKSDDGRNSRPEQLAFSSDGRQLAILERPTRFDTQQQIRVVDLSAGEARPQVFGLGDIDRALIQGQSLGGMRPVFSPDGKRLLWIRPRWEPKTGQITIVDALSGKDVQVLDWKSAPPIDSFAFSNDLRLCAACGCRMGTGTEDDPDGRYFGYTGGHVRVWDVESGVERFRLDWKEGAFWNVAFSPDGEILAVGGGEFYGNRVSGEVRLLDATTGKPLHTLRGHKQPIISLAFSPDGETLVSSGRDRTLKFWNVGKGTENDSLLVADELRNPGNWGVFSLAYSPDGEMLAVGLANWNRWENAGELQLFHPKTKKLIDTVWKNHHEPVLSAAFSPDGKKLAACAPDIVGWEIRRGQGDK